MSTYPTAYDATFPGAPYVDNTQFVDQSQANAWVAAIQAIEQTVGYGTIGTPGSPLYSAAYAKTYSTFTARVAALESNVVNGIKINSSNGNIQSVGVANQAGNTGLAADAGHVHAGQAAGLTQVGQIIMWPAGASTFPANYVLCNGQLIATATFSVLFGILGYAYGGGGASFGVPNFNDRVPMGVGTTASSVGATGGSQTITQANLPTHSHGVNISDPGHAHNSYIKEAGNFFQGIYLAPGSEAVFLPTIPSGGVGVSWSPGSPIDPGHQNSWATAGTGITATTSGTGSGTNYNQPFIGMNFLIRAA